MKTPQHSSCKRHRFAVGLTAMSSKRTTSAVLLALLWLPLAATAQDEKVTIVGPLPDGTPPPPAPKIELPEVEIRETVVRQLPDRKITINRIKDPGLPDPRPVLKKTVDLTPEEIEAYRNSPEVRHWIEEAAKTTHLFISATVIDHRATLLRWWHDGQEYRAWSTADWMILTGFAECQKGDRRFVTLLMAGNIDSASLSKNSPYHIPADLPVGPATYRVIKGDLENTKAFEGITALHELYQTDEARLRQAYDLREQRRKERATELLANPPEPEDIVLHYWKVQPKKQNETKRPEGTTR